MVQRRAARWVSNSYYDSVSAMLCNLGWRSHEYRCYDSRLGSRLRIYVCTCMWHILMNWNSIVLYKIYLFCSWWCTLLCYTKYAQTFFFLSPGLFCFLPYSYLGWARHGQCHIYHHIYIIMAELNILSVNCQGIGLLPKRTDVLNYLKGKGCQIYCLQDTHFSPGVDKKFVRSRWNSDCYFSSYKSNARGISILFAKNFEYKVHKSISDPNVNFLLLDLTVHNNRYAFIASIYGPNIDNPGFFFQTVSEKIELLHMRHLLEGGFSRITTLWHTLIQTFFVSLFSIPLVLKCAAKILKIGLQIKI